MRGSTTRENRATSDMQTLYLGTHIPHWIEQDGPPLMISLNRIRPRHAFTASVGWFLDSGGFTELQQHGRWRTTPEQHVERTRHAAQFGRMEHASPQDWMCEPAVIAGGQFKTMRFAGTGKSVREHQERTVENYITLMEIAPDLPWVPVLQGWTLDDYHHCASLYQQAGVDLENAQLVGLGSVCRREATDEAAEIVRVLATTYNIKLHGFGFKQAGIAASWPWLESADSMAWSYRARASQQPCTDLNRKGQPYKTCANCRHFALDWWHRTMNQVAPLQLAFKIESTAQ